MRGCRCWTANLKHWKRRATRWRWMSRTAPSGSWKRSAQGWGYEARRSVQARTFCYSNRPGLTARAGDLNAEALFMAPQMQGKVALVTGGGSGIGRAASIAFARAGARVVIGDVVAEGGNRTVELIKDTGGDATFVQTDVTLAKQVERLVKTAIDTYGGLDCAYNNAGVEGSAAGLVECTEEDWQRVIAVNLTGVWLCMKHEIPAMIKRGGGAIVNTSSILGLVAAPAIPSYVASKHGVAGLTKEAALEFA